MLDSLESAVASNGDSADGGIAPCLNLNADLAAFCRGLLLKRRAQVYHDHPDAFSALADLERAANAYPKAFEVWYELGEIRLILNEDSIPSREGPLLPTGSSNVLGAQNAFVEALRLDAGYAPAANALALSPLPREGAKAINDRLLWLRKSRRILSPGGLTRAADLERRTGHPDSAVALYDTLLRSGIADSGIVLLSMARCLYQLNRPQQGRNALLLGASTGDPSAVEAYRRELALTATPGELLEWDSLPASARRAWLADYWNKRDISAGLRDGEALIEHYRRVEYATTHFPVSLPQTGRQRLLTFTPDMMYYWEAEAAKCAVRNPDVYPELARFQLLSESIGTDDPTRYYRPIQNDFDDRGVVWIRYGKPSRMVADASGRPVEVWRYDTPNGPLILHFLGADFQGSVGASVLVPTLLTLSLGVRNRVCGIDPALCGMASGRLGPVDPSHASTGGSGSSSAIAVPPGGCARPAATVAAALNSEIRAEGTALAPEAIIRSRDAGRAEIDLATTTDDYHREFKHLVQPIVQFYGLSRGPEHSGRLLIVFAIPGNELVAEKRRSAGEQIYAVHMHVAASRIGATERVDLDTTRDFAVADKLRSGEYLIGTLEQPLPPGPYRASVSLTQAPDRGGAVFMPRLQVPAVSGRLTLSDVILGSNKSGLAWNSGTANVPLNPLNAFAQGGNAELYFQVGGTAAGEDLKLDVKLFRNDDASPTLTIAASQRAAATWTEVTQTLGLSTLHPGTYRLRITVSDTHDTVSRETSLNILP